MIKPDIPADEADRLEALQALRILDTPPEERFDRLTRLASYVSRQPIALVSLVDKDRQWFKSRVGLDATETPRDVSFCGHAILHDEIFIIENALLDPRFADNPLVTGGPAIRFYAGVPLKLPNGFRVGTLCVIGPEPARLDAGQRDALLDIANAVVSKLAQQEIIELANSAKAQEVRLRSVLDTVVDGIITIDQMGTVLSLNKATEKLFGYSPGEVIGQNVRMLMPEPYHGEHDGYLARYRATRVPRVMGQAREVTARRKDGSTFPISLAVGEMLVDGKQCFTGIVRDISVAKDVERRMHASLAFQQAILDGAGASIISTDLDGMIKSINHAGQRMLGYTAEELVDKTSPAIIHVADEVVRQAARLSEETGAPVEPGFEVFFARARAGVTDTNEWTYVRKDGSTFPVELTVTALADDRGTLIGFLGIATDISARRAAERAKSEFISTVSHELRTPLTSIRGALGLVLARFNEGMSEKALRLIDTANRNSERLTLLINDILDLEKLEAGKMEFHLDAADLVAVLERAIAANEGFATHHGVQLNLVRSPKTAGVRIDEHRIQQVIANLISNAVKYSPTDGKVEIALDHDGNDWRVSIRDFGRGIPEEFHARIFQRFSQADSSDAREKSGTGLGLNICKAIIDRHSGTIGFQSKPGSGTTFHFCLPKGALPGAAVAAAAPGAPAPRVLLCERNADVSTAICKMLAEQGIEADRVSSAAEALARLAETPYHALLLSVGEADGKAFELIHQVRADKALRSLPVVVLSTVAHGAHQEEIAGLEVHSWLLKPVDRQRLQEALSTARPLGARPRLLHVEDDLDLIQVAQGITETIADYEYACTFADASRLLSANRYDLLLLDIGLPDGDGRDLIPLAGPTTRVIVFSGDTGELHRETAVAAALVKSQVSNDKLMATIRRVLALPESRT